jgi:8-amino-7-oxononanoate synthase
MLKNMQEDFLHKKLNERKDHSAMRQMRLPSSLVDFTSNDYLGIARNSWIEKEMDKWKHKRTPTHGSTGSRLLSGNYEMIEEAEKQIAHFHDSPAGLIYNSGYDANLGLLSSVTQRGDIVLYDQFSHASIRDGIRLSFAQSQSFRHNDMEDLEVKLQKASGNIFIVTESVFSMDGDLAPLIHMASLAEAFGARLIVDEAHATGVIGGKGEGLVQHLMLQGKCFARVHTFGKALGCHGAIVLGSATMVKYLVNFSRAFIYTTAIPESAVAAILASYKIFPSMESEREKLKQLVQRFREHTGMHERKNEHAGPINSLTPIQGFISPGNEQVRALSAKLAQAGLDARPILYPTVARGAERLRIILHAHNTMEELDELTRLLYL